MVTRILSGHGPQTFAALSRCVIAEHHNASMKELIQLVAAEQHDTWRQIALLQGILPPPSPKKVITSATTRPTTAPVLAPKAPVKLIYLDAEPVELSGLLHSGDSEVRNLSAKLNARLAWPGKPGVPERPKIVPLTAFQQKQFDRGKLVFTQICAACHQPTGLGQEGLAPPLVDSEWVLGTDARLVRIVLHGLNGPITVGGAPFRLEMPALATVPDEDIAATLTYVRREWEHDGAPVSVERVTEIRAATRSRADLWAARELLEVKD